MEALKAQGIKLQRDICKAPGEKLCDSMYDIMDLPTEVAADVAHADATLGRFCISELRCASPWRACELLTVYHV